MTCQACDTDVEKVGTDLPFKTSDDTIVILKGLPVCQCPNSLEYLIG